MIYAVRKDGLGARQIESQSEAFDFEIVTNEYPWPLSIPAEYAERAWRDGEIARVRWLRERHRDEVDLSRPTTLEEGAFEELLQYIQSLRDWPALEGYPDRQNRPAQPAWMENY